MYPSVKKVSVEHEYTLLIDFDNGEKGRLDMEPFLNFGIFTKLQDRNAFNRVRVAFDTIEWDFGIDLDPEFIYEKCEIKQISK